MSPIRLAFPLGLLAFLPACLWSSFPAPPVVPGGCCRGVFLQSQLGTAAADSAQYVAVGPNGEFVIGGDTSGLTASSTTNTGPFWMDDIALGTTGYPGP